MSENWPKDIHEMHKKFGVHEWFEKNKHDKELMSKYLTFRLNMCLEELLETAAASGQRLLQKDDGRFAFVEVSKETDAEEIVDGLIDLCVFAVGTLDVFGVDANRAWDEVYKANIVKTPGVKEGRPNQFGLPDLIKPKKETHGYDWVSPDHSGNHGNLPKRV